MTALDTRARNTAERMIDKFGKVMSLNRATVGAYDPSTGNATETPSLTTIKGVVSKPSPIAFGMGLAQRGDMKVLVAAQPLDTLVPAPGDELIFDSKTWQVVSVD